MVANKRSGGFTLRGQSEEYIVWRDETFYIYPGFETKGSRQYIYFVYACSYKLFV